MNALRQIPNFKQALNALALQYNLNNYHQFNLFKVMFKMHDEKYLHSRFISFLLDPNGSHQQGNSFLQLFLNTFNLPDFSLEGVTLNPNEVDRGEKYNIDILIQNNQHQAIIIENKIFANDSNKPEGFELADPFLRYQLPRYYRKIALDEKKRNEVVAIVYLTINGKLPKDFDNFPQEVQQLIHRKEHLSDIQTWLTACSALLKEDTDLKRTIQQYIQARKEFLNDVHLAIDLREIFGKNIDESYEFIYGNDIDFVENAAVLQNEFIHVKWHVVHEFYSLLKNEIEKTFGVIIADIDSEKITALTHRSAKTATTLTFDYNSQTYYICNDKQGFSIGVNRVIKQGDDFKLLFKDKNYAFFDFKQREVFNLIEPVHRDNLINDIASELAEFCRDQQY